MCSTVGSTTEQKTLLESVVLCVRQSKMREGRNRLLRGGKDRGGERLMKVIEKEKVGKRKEKK